MLRLRHELRQPEQFSGARDTYGVAVKCICFRIQPLVTNVLNLDSPFAGGVGKLRAANLSVKMFVSV